jgi:transcriptional regulator with XRE-family HTH domain
MKMHHAKAHGESISGFQFNCSQCNKEIFRKGRQHKEHFCSDSCKNKYQSENFAGENNPRSVGGKYTDKSWLKKKYLVEGKTQKQIARVCGVSDVTIGNWLDKFDIPTITIIGKSGEEHPRWSEEYDRRPQEWFDLRDELLAESDKCEYCGNSGNIHIHHIEPVYLGGDVIDNEFVALCERCHIGNFKKWHPPQLSEYIDQNS